MSNEHSNILSGDNESLNKMKDKLSIIEKLSIENETKVINKSKPTKRMIPSFIYEKCLRQRIKNKLDIDIGYAISLLKKEDQNVNVYVCVY